MSSEFDEPGIEEVDPEQREFREDQENKTEFAFDKTTFTFDEIVERITTVLQMMSGEELAELYNFKIGDGLTYLGDDLFEQQKN